VHFAESCCVVALGIDLDGTKHPLALVEGSTENATLVTELCVDLRERGLEVTKPILVVLDGSKALRRAVLDVFDHPVIARCQLHKIRNVRDHVPQRMRTMVERRMRAAYHAGSALEAEAQLSGLARELDKTHPSAANSLREGLAETLTVLVLDVPPTLARTLRSTNAIVIWSPSEDVRHVVDGRLHAPGVPAGRGYLPRSTRRVAGRFGVRSAGGAARLVA
jgi:transposase-like protein